MARRISELIRSSSTISSEHFYGSISVINSNFSFIQKTRIQATPRATTLASACSNARTHRSRQPSLEILDARRCEGRRFRMHRAVPQLKDTTQSRHARQEIPSPFTSFRDYWVGRDYRAGPDRHGSHRSAQPMCRHCGILVLLAHTLAPASSTRPHAGPTSHRRMARPCSRSLRPNPRQIERPGLRH